MRSTVACQRTRIVSGTLNPVFRFDRDDLFTVVCSDVHHMMDSLTTPLPSNDSSLRFLKLHVKDKDPGSEDLIGTATLSVDVLLTGIHDLAIPELPTPQAREAWVLQNKEKLLCLPLYLQNTNGSWVQRGEILLATSSSSSAYGSVPHYTESHPLHGFKQAMVEAKSTLAKCTAWKDLEALHLFTYRNYLCRQPPAGSVEQQVAHFRIGSAELGG